MIKKILDEDQHLKILNEKLRAHQNYQKGMKVVGVPKGYSGSDLDGYKIEGPGPVRGLVADIDAAIRDEYDIQVSPRSDD